MQSLSFLLFFAGNCGNQEINSHLEYRKQRSTTAIRTRPIHAESKAKSCFCFGLGADAFSMRFTLSSFLRSRCDYRLSRNWKLRRSYVIIINC